MTSVEEPLVLACGPARLLAILHRPAVPRSRAVLVIVGGPQYRVGSHRQFVLLARELAAGGFPVLRFDYRGMGDSEATGVSFEDTAPDIAAAIERLLCDVPEVREVVIWGLCDGASAALLYAFTDPRVKGLVLLNPWVRTEQGEARTYLRHYYKSRFLDPAQWKRIVTGKVNLLASVRDLVGTAQAGLSGSRAATGKAESYVTRMRKGMEGFEGQTLLILSGDDLTAKEFKDEVARTSEWARALGRDSVEKRELVEANHTFSRRNWRDQVAGWTRRWMESW
jgi:exosortase A-associated hydrolase 1